MNDLRPLPATVREAAAGIAHVPPMEAVPPHMMELFTDQQWPDLVFQLQPSLRLVTVPGGGQQDDAGWVVFRRADESLARPADSPEFQGLLLIASGASFDRVASALWPDSPVEARYERLTAHLLSWLEEGLIVDAGVPLPPDAEFETSPDEATQSYASSRARETRNR